VLEVVAVEYRGRAGQAAEFSPGFLRVRLAKPGQELLGVLLILGVRGDRKPLSTQADEVLAIRPGGGDKEARFVGVGVLALVGERWEEGVPVHRHSDLARREGAERLVEVVAFGTGRRELLEVFRVEVQRYYRRR